MSVFKKLQKARVLLQKQTLSKSGKNKFAGYEYFELGDFIPSVQQIFNDLGLCGMVSYTADLAYLHIQDTDGEGCITFTSPMSSAALKGCHEVQNLGAVQSYLRRYLWVTALEIVEHDALDSVTGSSEPEKKVEKKVEKKEEKKVDEKKPEEKKEEPVSGEIVVPKVDSEADAVDFIFTFTTEFVPTIKTTDSLRNFWKVNKNALNRVQTFSKPRYEELETMFKQHAKELQ